MAVDTHVAMLDWTVLEGVARRAVAELTLAAPSVGRDEARRSADTVEPGREIVVVEVTSTGGAALVTEHELSRAIETALRSVIGRGEVMVFSGGDLAAHAVWRKLLERLPSMIAARRQHLTDKHIEALVDAYLPADALAPVMPDIEADNAKAQADFLRTYPFLTADQVAERAGHSAVNRSATAHRWKAEQKIFAIRVGGRDVYPAFQFKDGQPRAALRSAMRALGSRSGWQTAFWFITPNSWLGGHAPIDRLEDDAAVSAAAVHEAEVWAG